MPDSAVITNSPHSGDNSDVPHLSIAFWQAPEDKTEVDFVVHVLETPTDEPASNALLTGLAILALERQGYVAKAIERMFPDGRPTEKEATAQVHLLLAQETNVLPA